MKPVKRLFQRLPPGQILNLYHALANLLGALPTDTFTMLPPASYLIKDSGLLILFGKTEDLAKAAGG
jgi:hypothetical protein